MEFNSDIYTIVFGTDFNRYNTFICDKTRDQAINHIRQRTVNEFGGYNETCAMGAWTIESKLATITERSIRLTVYVNPMNHHQVKRHAVWIGLALNQNTVCVEHKGEVSSIDVPYNPE